MALSEQPSRLRSGREYYLGLASRNCLNSAPVSSFPFVPLSWRYDENITEGLLLEAAHCSSTHAGTVAHWFASVVEKQGYYVRLRWLAATDSSRDFWRIFPTYEEPTTGALDERVHPVGWAKRNRLPLQPPPEIRDARQDWMSLVRHQLKACAGVLGEGHQEIAREENECSFGIGMEVEVTDITQMDASTPAIIKNIIGRRIEFECIETKQTCWFHEFSDKFQPSGFWSLIRRELNSGSEYRKLTASKLTRFGEPPTEGEATIAHFKPLLVPDFLAERFEKYRFKPGSRLEVIDPLRPGISSGIIIEELPNKFLLIEINHIYPRDGMRDYRICVHAASDILLPPGFAEKNGAQFNPPQKNFRYVESKMVPTKMLQRTIPPHGFKVGQILEVLGVTGSNQMFVGRIKRIVGHLLYIHFEGLDKEEDHYFPMMSTDIYPVGWSDFVNHPLLPPRSTPILQF